MKTLRLNPVRLNPLRLLLLAGVAWPFTGPAAQVPAAQAEDLVNPSRVRWEQSAHGEMLRRIIPPTVEPAKPAC